MDFVDHSAITLPLGNYSNNNWKKIEDCVICDRVISDIYFSSPPFEYLKCHSCNVLTVSPRLRDNVLDQLYDQDYWRSESPSQLGYANYVEEGNNYLRTFNRRIDSITAHLPRPGMALDVGCAAGWCMKVLEDRGWDVYGVEPSLHIGSYAKNKFGFSNLHLGKVDTMPWKNLKFSLITLWDVIEHIPEPVKLLKTLRSMLAESGIIVVETQNYDSFTARVMGRSWHHYKHFEHIYHFDRSSIHRLFSQSGLRLEYLSSKNAGKYVSTGFIFERMGRLPRSLSWSRHLLKPVTRQCCWINLHDELIAIAQPDNS